MTMHRRKFREYDRQGFPLTDMDGYATVEHAALVNWGQEFMTGEVILLKGDNEVKLVDAERGDLLRIFREV